MQRRVDVRGQRWAGERARRSDEQGGRGAGRAPEQGSAGQADQRRYGAVDGLVHRGVDQHDPCNCSRCARDQASEIGPPQSCPTVITGPVTPSAVVRAARSSTRWANRRGSAVRSKKPIPNRSTATHPPPGPGLGEEPAPEIGPRRVAVDTQHRAAHRIRVVVEHVPGARHPGDVLGGDQPGPLRVQAGQGRWLWPRRRPLARATAIAPRVRKRMRSISNWACGQPVDQPPAQGRWLCTDPEAERDLAGGELGDDVAGRVGWRPARRRRAGVLGELAIRAVDLRLVEVRGRPTPVSRLSGNSRVLGRGSREHGKCRDCGWDVLVGWCRRFTASGEPFDPLGVLCQ